MPSLPSALQSSANDAAASGGDFKALDPGVYTARLSKVDVKQTRGNDKNPPSPMWALEFDQVYDLNGDKCTGRLWTNLVLIDAVAWKIGQFYGAFGVPTSTDAEEMINYRIRLEVSQRVQTVGKNAGKTINEIYRFAELAEGDIGYEAGQKLKTRATVASPKKAAVKAAPAKAAAKPVAAAAEDIPDAEDMAADADAESLHEPANDDPTAIDF